MRDGHLLALKRFIEVNSTFTQEKKEVKLTKVVVDGEKRGEVMARHLPAFLEALPVCRDRLVVPHV